MAENETKVDLRPESDGFQKVTRRFQIRGGAKREHPACKVNSAGRAAFNMEASELVHRVAESLGMPGRYMVAFSVHEAKGIVAAYLTAQEVEGSMPVQLTAVAPRLVTMHLGGVFAQVPSLRPTGVVRCAVHREVDAAGTPYIRISLANAVPVRRLSRSGKVAPDLTTPGQSAGE
ncbi:MAG: hypothetical protein ACM3XM_19350 [Mycobacterium leprae]